MGWPASSAAAAAPAKLPVRALAKSSEQVSLFADDTQASKDVTVSEQFELAIDDSWHPERAAIPSLEQLPTNTVDGNNVGDDLASLSHPIATPFENQQRELTVPAPIAARDERTNAHQAKQRLEADEAPPKPDEKKIPKSASPLLSRFLATRAATNRPAVGIRPPDQFSGPDKPGSDSGDTDPLLGDPELGVVQVAEVQRDDELGVIQLRSPLQDAELGILELQQISQLSRRAPFVFLSGYITASSSDNVFLVEDPVQGRFGDNFIRPGVTITAFPALGPNTNLLVSGRTSFLRYEEQSNSSYDELRVQAGVRHRFTNRVYGQLSVSNQLLFDEGYRDRFFTNTGLELLVGRRDRLTPQLTLDTLYQGQIFFSDPNEFSNVLNSVGASLNYRMSPQWDTSISYRLTISDFTQQSRHETYQRVIGQLRYSITPSVRMSLFGGLSYGRSSESRITFDDTFFGISFDATISIF